MKKILIILVSISVFIACSTTKKLPVFIPEDYAGLVHAGQSRTDREYEFIDEMGGEWILLTFNWSGIERQKGEWN
jgi:hypothetical protein